MDQTADDRLLQMPVSEAVALACQSHPGVWAEVKRGYTNAAFHWEWYKLALTESRCAVVAPREHGKTECLTVNVTAWRSTYQPGTWTYLFAQTRAQAERIKNRIDAALEETEPWMVEQATVRSRNESVYANGSTVTVAGAGTAVRSAHPDIIIGDDVLEESSTLTDYQRTKTERWWLGTIGGMCHPGTSRMVRGQGRIQLPATRVFLVGTPFHANDLLMGMRNNPIYRFYRYAAEYDPDDLPVPGSLAFEVA